MPDTDLKLLLHEYELKRNNAISQANKRKETIYNDNPRLQEIDTELSTFAIKTAKAILQTNNKALLKDLDTKSTLLKKEKLSILHFLGIDETYFLPKYECAKCNDTGYITENYTTTMCNCLKQRIFDIKYNKFNVYDIKNDSFENFRTDIYSNEVNVQKYHFNVSPQDNIKNIQKIAKHFIDNFNDPTEKNLLFTGNTGLGKTFISHCIANELLKHNKTVLYQTAPIMLDTIIDCKMGKNSNFDILHHILTVDLLVIDDLGTEKISNWALEKLFTVLNSRLLSQNNHITKTIISTNLSINNLAQMYGERIVSRLIGNYNICAFFGEDLRRKNL